jgi:hypothetical protein
LGETGTGKELVPDAIQAAALTLDEPPSVGLNCAALPALVAESELFGGRGAHSNKLRRPVGGTNDAVLAWVQKNVLSEELMLVTLAKIRARLKAGNQRTAADLPQLKGRVAKLTAEIQNLVDVMAVTPPAQVGHLVDAMKDRDVERQGLVARINAEETAPEALPLEVRRLEAESRKLLADLRRAAELEPEKARELLVRLFDGKLEADDDV